MSDVKRWSPMQDYSACFLGMRESVDGAFVRFDDYAAALSCVAEAECERDELRADMGIPPEWVHVAARQHARDTVAALSLEHAAREKAEGERDRASEELSIYGAQLVSIRTTLHDGGFFRGTVDKDCARLLAARLAAESALSEARAETERIRTKWETCEAQWLDELNIASGEKGLAEGRAERAEAALSDARELLAGAVKSLSVGGMHLSALKLRDALRAAGLLTTEASDGR